MTDPSGKGKKSVYITNLKNQNIKHMLQHDPNYPS
jgi:hypothetical protein